MTAQVVTQTMPPLAGWIVTLVAWLLLAALIPALFLGVFPGQKGKSDA